MISKPQLAGMLSMLAAIPGAFAQPAEVSKREANVFYMQAAAPGPGEHTFEFVASGFRFEGNPVKNAPAVLPAMFAVNNRPTRRPT